MESARMALEPGFPRIYLAVCGFDDKVLLTFERPNLESKFIKLQWGGDPSSWGSEVLWRQPRDQ